MNSLIATSKQGNCSRCPATNTAVKKRGKDLLCLQCCKSDDVLKQMDKAKKRHGLKVDMGKVKKLGKEMGMNVNDVNVQELKNDLDRVFSMYIRLKYATSAGVVTCFTCDKPMHWLSIHNGHFIKRSANLTRFMEANCKPQCPQCNLLHNDDESIFERKLEADSPGIVEYLREQGSMLYKFTRDELKQMLVEYHAKLKLVKSKLINQ